MSVSIDMTGRVALITGGGRGVGRGISEAFLDAGSKVVICGRNAPDSLPRVQDNEAIFAQADVREPEAAASVVAFAVERYGRLDALVNNAGGAPEAEAATASPRFSESILRLNLNAALHFSQAANAIMQPQDDGGAIVQISSVSGMRPSPGTAAYGAAKAGLISLAQTLAVEWAPKVRVNSVAAGMIRTEQAHLHYGDEEGIARVAATVPLGRLGEPRDVGDVCLFLCSPLARYLSGANLLLHGGGERPAFKNAARTTN